MNCCEVMSIFSMLRQQLLGVVLFFQPGIDDRIAGIEFAAHTGMHHHFLGRFMHGQQLAQLYEWLFARLGVRRMQHFVEHVLDEVVLRFEETRRLRQAIRMIISATPVYLRW